MFKFGKPTMKKFAAELRKTIQNVTGETYEFDSENNRLFVPGQGDNGSVNLVNIFAEHCQLSKQDRPGNFLRIASLFDKSNHELPDNFEDAKQNLRPKIWCRSTFAMMELKVQLSGGQMHDIPLYPLGSHLYTSLVYDTPNSMRSLSNQDLENWGVTYFEAMEHACRNLDESSLVFASIGDNLHSSDSGDNYDSARVLLLDRVKSFSVVGEHVAMVPQRDAMYVTGSDDPDLLTLMFQLSDSGDEQEIRPLSPLPLVLRDGQWEDWTPPQNHIIREAFDLRELYFLGSAYAKQKQLLDQIFELKLIDLFVASFSVIEMEETEMHRSYCVWLKGIDALLPRTQLVMMLDSPDGDPVIVEWDHVREAMGDLIVEDDSFYPPRYKVTEFPNDAQLAELRTVEL